MRPLSLLLCLGVLVLPLAAQAYPWMIKHNYANCGSCHVDPSGAGLLTPYGRAQTQLLLETQWSAPSEEGEVAASTGPFWGLVQPPEWLALGASFRGGALLTQTANPSRDSVTGAVRPIQMASDVRAGIVSGPFRAAAALGVALRRANGAALTRVNPAEDGTKLVAREYWAGVSLAEDAVLIRAGRMNLPFGLRSVEHNLWVRSETRTDLNDTQQHGLAVAINTEAVRAEVMGILGNYQLGPDIYRERGVAGYAEYAFAPRLAAGLSTLVTYAGADFVRLQRDALRMAYGAFGRFAPSDDLALMGELNALLSSNKVDGTYLGGVGSLQADLEVVRGLHLMGTVEALRRDMPGQKSVQLGGGLGAAWYLARGVELRVDSFLRQIPQLDGEPMSQMLVFSQLHLYL